jgi:hypothetical protein
MGNPVGDGLDIWTNVCEAGDTVPQAVTVQKKREGSLRIVVSRGSWAEFGVGSHADMGAKQGTRSRGQAAER